MKIEQRIWTQKDGWEIIKQATFDKAPSVVFVFGGREILEREASYTEVQALYPESRIVLCSTAGEILDTRVYDDSLSVTAIQFDTTQLHFTKVAIHEAKDSEAKGKEIAEQLSHEGLKHVMVFAEGITINGTKLVEGLTGALPENVAVTGGLVGDGSDFKKTVVGLDEVPQSGQIVGIGFYGDTFRVGYGSLGGWEEFGPERLITKAEGNILYELDGEPALALYKRYLGERANELPSSGLLFPIRLKKEGDEDSEVVRTLLAVDEEKQSLTFAGDVPEGYTAILMKANFERLIDGAEGAAERSISQFTQGGTRLAMLISCVGRKLVLREGVEEEVEAVQAVVGDGTYLTGFYSYGEISPVTPTEKTCRLHNQTMTITIIEE
jgi:hypothetical protein